MDMAMTRTGVLGCKDARKLKCCRSMKVVSANSVPKSRMMKKKGSVATAVQNRRRGTITCCASSSRRKIVVRLGMN